MTFDTFRLVLIVFCVGFTLLGCSEISPWERGTLAKPEMALEPFPLQSTFRAHHYSSREAALGGNSAGGGGCGCN